MLVGGLALEHGAVLQLQVGQADLPGGDSPSEGPAWKTPDCVRSWRNAVTGEFSGSPHCVEAKAHLDDQTKTVPNSWGVPGFCLCQQSCGLRKVLQSTKFQ